MSAYDNIVEHAASVVETSNATNTAKHGRDNILLL